MYLFAKKKNFELFQKKVSQRFQIYQKQSVYEFIAANYQSYLTKFSSPVRVFKNPAYIKTMYTGHFQQLKRTRLQYKISVTAFLLNIACSKIFVLWISRTKFTTKTYIKTKT